MYVHNYNLFIKNWRMIPCVCACVHKCMYVRSGVCMCMHWRHASVYTWHLRTYVSYYIHVLGSAKTTHTSSCFYVCTNMLVCVSQMYACTLTHIYMYKFAITLENHTKKTVVNAFFFLRKSISQIMLKTTPPETTAIRWPTGLFWSKLGSSMAYSLTSCKIVRQHGRLYYTSKQSAPS